MTAFRRCEPEQQEEYQDLEERLWNVHHAGQPMPGREEAFGEDEDLIMENSRGDISKNPKCPISGVEVTQPASPKGSDNLSVGRCGGVCGVQRHDVDSGRIRETCHGHGERQKRPHAGVVR